MWRIRLVHGEIEVECMLEDILPFFCVSERSTKWKIGTDWKALMMMMAVVGRMMGKNSEFDSFDIHSDKGVSCREAGRWEMMDWEGPKKEKVWAIHTEIGCKATFMSATNHILKWEMELYNSARYVGKSMEEWKHIYSAYHHIPSFSSFSQTNQRNHRQNSLV